MNKLLYSHLELLKLKHVLASYNLNDDEYMDYDFLLDLVKDETLLERCEEQRYLTADSPGTFNSLKGLLMAEFVHHIDKTFFKELEEIPNDISPFIDAIIRNPQCFKDGLSQKEIEGLMLFSFDKKYIDNWLKDFKVSKIIRNALMDNIKQAERRNVGGLYDMLNASEAADYIDSLNMEILDEEIKTAGQPGRNEDLNYVEYVSLSYNGREKRAIQVYGGVTDGKDPIASLENGYDTLNMLLFPGTGNEKERIINEGRPIATAALRDPDVLLDYYLDIYSAMYKYGKKTTRDYQTKRVDRSYSLRAMEEEGNKTLSYYSTSEVPAFLDGFASKKGIDLVNVTITQGTPCLEFMDVLGETYMHAHEHEILLPPGIGYTIEEEELTEGDLTIRDMDGNPPNRKVHITTIPRKEKAKPLTEEEIAAMEEQERIFYDEQNINTAMKYLQMLRSKRLDPMLDFSNVEPALEIEYLRWKSALHRLYKYRTREIEVEIDREFEEEKANRESEAVQYTTLDHEGDDRFYISEDEFSEQAKLEDMKSLKKALGGLASLFKGLKNIDDKDDKGEEK